MPIDVWSLLYYFALVLVLMALILTVSFLLGQRHREPGTGSPFESGVAPTGSARLRVSVNYYVVALLFVIFDLEAIFLFAWAVAARPAGWPGYWGALVFTAILVIALIYEWRIGALDWNRPPPERTD